MNFRQLLLVATSALLFTAAAAAATFPDKPVRIVVAYAAGGAVDAIGRDLANGLSQAWGQPVIVDNRPGATGSVGAQAVLGAPADGYTLLMTASAPVALYPAISVKPPHDYLTEFIPVTTVASWDLILVVPPSLPVDNVQGLIAFARTHPGQVSFSSAGIGAVNHVAGAVFAKLNNVDLVHVPYKGDGPAVTDLIAGRVTMSFLSSQVALPQIQAGRLKALAIAGPHRLPFLPQVPTMIEAGTKGFEFTAWAGLFAPAGVPAAVVHQIQEAVARAMSADAVRQRLSQSGTIVDTTSSAAFAQRIKRELAKWRNFGRLTGISVD